MGLALNHFVPCLKDTNEYLKSISVKKLNTTFVYTNKFKNLICLSEFDDNEKFIYFKSLGYQSGGINKQFYKEFTNDTIYFQLQDIEKAYKYLATDQLNRINNLQKNFKDNFINNFIEGKSIFHVSW